MSRLVLISVFLLTLLASACSSPSDDLVATTTTSPPTSVSSTTSLGSGEVVLQPASLTQAPDCDQLLGFYQERALEIVGPYGLGGDFGIYPVSDTTMEAAESGGDDADGGSSGHQTNVQVEGVDEADVLKSDGRFIYDIMNHSRLRIWETTDEGLEARGRLRFDENSSPQGMLLSGDTLVIITSRWQAPSARGGADIAWDRGGSQYTELIEVDISDRSDPREIRSIVFDGNTLSSRLVGDSLRLVLQSGTVGVEWEYPKGSGLRAEREATERNKEIIRETTIDNWLPYSVITGPDGEEEGVMLDCDEVLLPAENNGIETLTILEFDIGSGIDSWSAGGVVAKGETVYANAERVYVATGIWQNPIVFEGAGDEQSDPIETRTTTSIHRFDTPADGEPVYIATGEVPGYLLNQFAMDEYEGHLRVASTDEPGWWGVDDGTESESHVTVLRTEGDELVEVGSIDGLGVTERIYAVRFMGDMGYVVTFRQVDPLYTLDLSDPTAPEMKGELKIKGYSAYLHPLEAGRLLGVGQNATDDGMTTGLQASLFDVSDLSDPTRLDTAGVRDAYSPIEYDHHAFTTDGDTAYVPYESWSFNEGDQTETLAFGVLAIPLTGDDLSDTRELIVVEGKADGAGDPWRFSPQRTLVFDDTLYAYGHGGITVIDLPSGEVTDQIRS